jgi:hypothetical protein
MVKLRMNTCLGLVIGLGLQTAVHAQDLKDIKAAPGAPRMTVTNTQGHVAHLFPTVQKAAALRRAMGTVGGSGPLTYHGGPIMPAVLIYNIFWAPAKLQDGTSTFYHTAYPSVQNNLVAGYLGHGLSSINTQYYQDVSSVRTYILGTGGYAGFYIDTAAYPASGCSDSARPHGCITDAQVRAEITKVMGIKGWTGGMNKIFMLYTSYGEGSCFDGTNTQCAYTYYCAYHSYISGTPNIIYAYEPYGDTSICAAGTFPNGNGGYADSTTSSASHEISEAITDPLLNAWYDAAGYENGDKCAYDYGTNTWTNPANGITANQMWGASYFELQQEWSNHTNNCLQAGP